MQFQELSMKKICITPDCGNEFDPSHPLHQGKAYLCDACGAGGEVEKVKGFTVVEGKNATYVQVMSATKHAKVKNLARVGSVRTH